MYAETFQKKTVFVKNFMQIKKYILIFAQSFIHNLDA